MAVQHSYGKIVTDGLVLSLDASDRNSYVSGSATWRDLAGTNNGTLTNGPTFSSAGNASSIVFDGVDDYSSQTYRGLPNGLTLNSWIKTTSSKSTKNYDGNASNNIIGDTTGTVWIGFGVTNGKVNYNNAKKTGEWSTSQYYSTASVNDGSWKYITVTHDKTTELVNLYINGILDSIYNNSSTGIYDQWSYTAFNTLCRGYLNSDYFNGTIGIVQIYNRTLTPTEILQNYNAQKSRFGLT